MRDYAQVHDAETITLRVTAEALRIMEVDALGLENTDIKILETIITKYNGGPVGLKTIAAATSEELETIEDIYEPYLLQIGFLNRSLRGRIATQRAYEHLGIPFYRNENQGTLI